MPEGAVYVGRPTKWGNPWRPVEVSPGLWAAESGGQRNGRFPNRRLALQWCVVGYRTFGPLDDITSEDVRAELAGRDLACWCPLDQPCHADVLLQLANDGCADRPLTPATSHRPRTPDLIRYDDAGNETSRTVTMQRACNGCGRRIGDVTEAELDAAVAGRPLPDVREECGCA
jgi:hypothetical protein